MVILIKKMMTNQWMEWSNRFSDKPFEQPEMCNKKPRKDRGLKHNQSMKLKHARNDELINHLHLDELLVLLFLWVNTT